jgi:hypothetical protein
LPNAAATDDTDVELFLKTENRWPGRVHLRARRDLLVTDPEQPMTLGAPPHLDYLAEGATRSTVLDLREQVAREMPEAAPAYLRWLVTEVRSSGWAETEGEAANQ